MSDGSNVTLKAGKGFEAPWITLYGTPNEVRLQIQDYFGLTPEELAGKTTAELVVEATARFQEIAAGKALTPIGQPEPRTGRARPHVPAAGSPAQQGQVEAVDPNQILLEEIAAATSKNALTEVYARNKAAFEAEQKAGTNVLRAALKARLGELVPSDEN